MEFAIMLLFIICLLGFIFLVREVSKVQYVAAKLHQEFAYKWTMLAITHNNMAEDYYKLKQDVAPDCSDEEYAKKIKDIKQNNEKLKEYLKELEQ